MNAALPPGSKVPELLATAAGLRREIEARQKVLDGILGQVIAILDAESADRWQESHPLMAREGQAEEVAVETA